MQKCYNFNEIESLIKIDLNHTVDNIYLAIEIVYRWNCFQPRIFKDRIVYFICIIAPQLKDNNRSSGAVEQGSIDHAKQE